VTLVVVFGNTRLITNTLNGGTGVAASLPVIPKPNTLISVGTGLIGLAGMMGGRRKLRT